ncbi:BLI-3 blue-light-inducible Bli-3 protein [Podospora bellae-mahoneyi]|uniref:BLI-3 blue-light-inducible Bli-3 protein n=1 Tax=Podospora bellae-mahoneyi TaxID=2093777 RepID=A0ABR0FBN7_9PEZI|nr:BLI-3 blue-light-inducible Bli-3 protein [Podospora bellae-mahoneyi]
MTRCNSGTLRLWRPRGPLTSWLQTGHIGKVSQVRSSPFYTKHHPKPSKSTHYPLHTVTTPTTTTTTALLPTRSYYSTAIMSSGFSNTSGVKHPDPYKEANLDTQVSTQTKLDDLSKFMDASKFCMMTTVNPKTHQLVSRCMALAGQENGGLDLLFHTNTESGKTDDLAADTHINVGFLNNSGEWASVSGTTEVITDRELVKKHYKPHLKAWVGDLGDGVHDGSANDPRIGIIRVKMATAHYAISHKNIAGRLTEVAKGVVTGDTAVVNKLREISEEEVSKLRLTH